MTLHYDIIITGKVQNVGFRFYAQKSAHELEITGFVKNQKDGSVYIEAEGEEESLKQFVDWCHKGPPWANVETVAANKSPVMNHRGFLVK
jgi:acylphosphatase